MTGFQSRVRDALNQAAPTHASVAVADRGLSYFIDPSLTGSLRFMQRSGYPFPLLTPQMTTALSATATAGSRDVVLQSSRLLPWLRPGIILSFELVESSEVVSFDLLPSGNIAVTLLEDLAGGHLEGSSVYIRAFVALPTVEQEAGVGGLGEAAASVLSPFLITPGDQITVDGFAFNIVTADLVGTSTAGFEYLLKVAEDDGLPQMATDTKVIVSAKAAYQSSILNMPHANVRTSVKGPVAVDWVSGPMVADYRPTPESRVFIEQFDSSGRATATAGEFHKNDTLTKLPIGRDQMLFWKVAEGGVNWNGTFMELRAYTSGRAHIWSPCRPPLDVAPVVTSSHTVPMFSPYLVLLNSNIFPEITVVESLTKADVPSSGYTVTTSSGNVYFDPSYAGSQVTVSYRPRLEWRLAAIPSVDDVELTVVVGDEPKQVFNLGLATTTTVCVIQTTSSTDIDKIHVTARRSDDSGGAFIVELGDWVPRGSTTGALRYTLLTGATVDYDWASSGLLLKSIWPNLELLKARLDGDSIFAQYLDNGRMLF